MGVLAGVNAYILFYKYEDKNNVFNINTDMNDLSTININDFQSNRLPPYSVDTNMERGVKHSEGQNSVYSIFDMSSTNMIILGCCVLNTFLKVSSCCFVHNKKDVCIIIENNEKQY